MKGRSETMTLKVKDQIRRVRNSGVTNMFDIDGVMQAATVSYTHLTLPTNSLV